MIARVSLEIALRKEFDYSIPPGLAGGVEVGTRVQVQFGARKILGTVTALAEESAHANLKPILKVIGAQTLVTPKILKLARWISDYYCCAPETALRSVLPEAIRKKEEGWKKQLFVRALPPYPNFLQSHGYSISTAANVAIFYNVGVLVGAFTFGRLLGALGTAAGAGTGDGAGVVRDSAVGIREHSDCVGDGRIRDSGRGAGRVGNYSCAFESAFAAGGAGLIPGLAYQLGNFVASPVKRSNMRCAIAGDIHGRWLGLR